MEEEDARFDPTPNQEDARFDAVFCDPPFANIDLLRLRETIEVLRPGASEDVPLYIAYNSRREEDLCSAFAAQGLERRRPLGYLSVKLKTQRQLFLYCPEGLGHNLGEEGALP